MTSYRRNGTLVRNAMNGIAQYGIVDQRQEGVNVFTG